MLLKLTKQKPKKLINFHVDEQTISDVEALLSHCGEDEGITKADIYRSALSIGIVDIQAYFEKIKKYDVKES